jgi:SAM-dependent methyltransferase
MEIYLDRDVAGYDKGIGRWTRRLTEPFLDFLELGPGERILDVGCGTGSVIEAVLRRLPGGEVHGCDLSRASVAMLRAQVLDPRLHVHVADANRLPLPDGYFDRSVSMFVLTFAGPGALAEKARVTRAGGWIAVGVPDFRDTSVMIRRLFDLAGALTAEAGQLRRAILGAPMRNPERAAAECRRLGLEQTEWRSLSVAVDYDCFASCWATLATMQGPNGAMVDCLPPSARVTLEDSLRRAYLAERPDGPRRETITIWALKARVPGT